MLVYVQTTIADTSSFPNLDSRAKEGFNTITAIYVSNTVPKLIPVKMMAPHLDNPDALSGNEGFVTNSQIQITNYHKTK
jgi:hypothetical protein